MVKQEALLVINRCKNKATRTCWVLQGHQRQKIHRKPQILQKIGEENRIEHVGRYALCFHERDGCNGRRIEEILYRYGKGEDVRIMYAMASCCHQQSLSSMLVAVMLLIHLGI